MKLSLRRLKLLIIAYALLGAGLVGVVIVTSLSSLRDIRLQSEQEHDVTDVLVTQLAQARMQLVQIQQYLSDASVTQLDTSIAEGYDALQQAQGHLREVARLDPSLAAMARQIDLQAQALYDTGLTMVKAYGRSRDSGNAVMKGQTGFDAQAEQLVRQVNLLEEQIRRLQADVVAGQREALDASSQLILVLGLILALLGLWAGSVLYRLVIGSAVAREQALHSLQGVMNQLRRATEGVGDMENDIGQLGHTISQLVQEREKAQLAMQEAKETAEASDRAKTQFLANLSHEVRTPLNGILGMAEVLEISGPLTPEQMHSLQHLKASAQGLLDMLLRMLDYAQLEAGEVEAQQRPYAPQSLLDALQQRHAAAARAKGLALTLDAAAALPPLVCGDERRTLQLLGELIGNAIKFTPAGQVSVYAEPWQDAACAGPCMRLSVQDSGPGIPAAQQQQLFRAFTQGDGSVTRSHAGNGLGLALARALATLMGGRLDMEQAPQGGSVFRVVLPAPAATDVDA